MSGKFGKTFQLKDTNEHRIWTQYFSKKELKNFNKETNSNKFLRVLKQQKNQVIVVVDERRTFSHTLKFGGRLFFFVSFGEREKNPEL